MRAYRRVLRLDPFLLIALGLFLLLTMPSIGNIPHLDGNILFVQSYDLYRDGFQHFLQKQPSTHPPLTMLIGAFGFWLGGVHAFSFNLWGRLFGLIGIVGIYQLSLRLMTRASARWSALLLAV